MSCKVLRERIMREQNVEVRKRQEMIMRRNHNILLLLFVGGGYLVFRSLVTYAQGIFMAAIFLAWYGYMENYLHRYEQYTNELIKGAKAPAKKAAAKRSRK